MKKKDKLWTKDELSYLEEHINTMPLQDIATHLNRTENCVNIKAHRLRIDRKKGGINKEMVSRNIVKEMLIERIGDPDSFRYTPKFRENTGILQKRFWQLYRGEKNITQQEYLALTREWRISLEDAFQMHQLKIEF